MDGKMIEHYNSIMQPQPTLGIFGLLRESFKTLKRNAKLLLPVLVLVVVFFSQLEFARSYFLEPLLKDFASIIAENPKLLEEFGTNIMYQTDYSGALNDIRQILRVCLVSLTISSIISLVFFVSIVSSSSEAYTGKVQNLQEMVKKMGKSWKKPILTSFYMILIITGYMVVCFLSIGVVSILFVGSWAYLLYGVVLFSILFLWIYVSALWMMSLVVSVLEGVGGLDAIARGKSLMEGRKVKASVLVVLFSVAYLVVHSMTNGDSSRNLENWPGMVISIVWSNGLLCGLKLVMLVVFTIFYHEQKDNFNEKVAESLYLPIVGDEV